MNRLLIFTHTGCLLFGLIAGFIFCQQSCSKCPPCPEIQAIIPVKQYKPVNIPNVQPSKPIQPKKVVKPIAPVIPPYPSVAPSVPFEADDDPCSALWDEFNTVKFYSETYRDSAMSITVSDSVAMNKVLHQSVSYLRLLPDKQVTVVKQFKFMLLADIGFNSFNGLSFGSSVVYSRYKFNYDYYPIGGVHQAGVGVVLFRR